MKHVPYPQLRGQFSPLRCRQLSIEKRNTCQIIFLLSEATFMPNFRKVIVESFVSL